MVVKLVRPQGDLIINPDNIINIVKSSFGQELAWSVVMASGDIVYINEDEMLSLEEALGLRDKQIQNLIDNTQAIIENLEHLNITSSSIDSTTDGIKTTTNNIYSQTKTNSTLLSNIKSVCDNILSWIRASHD